MNGWPIRVKIKPDKIKEILATPETINQLVWAAKNMLHQSITSLNNLPDSVHKQEIDIALLKFCSALERKVKLGTDALVSLEKLGEAIENEQKRLLDIVKKDDAAAAKFLKTSNYSDENKALFFEAMNGETIESLQVLKSFLTFRIELKHALQVSVKALVYVNSPAGESPAR